MKYPARIFLLCFLLPKMLWAQTNDTAAIRALWEHAHQIHEDSAEVAQAYCMEVLQKSAAAGYLKGQGDAYITLGAISRNDGHLPKSYEYLYRALDIRRFIGDSNRVAAVFINLAINMQAESKYDAAIATVLYAIKIVENLPKPEYDVLGSEYLLLSNIYDEYLEPEEALKYAQKSLWAYAKTNNISLIGKASYALANRFLALEQRDSALIYYDRAFLQVSSTSKDPRFLSDILTNKGIIYAQLGDYARSGALYEEAQKTLEPLGEDADYFHLYLNKGNWYTSQRDWASGLRLFQRAMPSLPADLSFIDQLFLYENLSDAYANLARYDSAYYFLKNAYQVRDTLYNEHKQKEIIRYQTERYKRENAQQALLTQEQASRARLFLQSSLLLLLLAIIIAYAYYQRKKSFKLIQAQQDKLHQQQVDELIQSSELRYLSAGLEGRELEKEQIARELHDQLGSTMVTLSWQYDAILENADPNSAQYHSLHKLNDALKQLYQDIRVIAHQLGSGVLERAGLIPVLTELCDNIEASNRIEVSFSHFGMESRLGFAQEVNVLRIIQELISNVLKYANATQLMLQINRLDSELNIMVEDNGLGFEQKTALQRSSTGLANIEARLRSLNGAIQFENRPMGGTTVIINVPIPKPEAFYDQTH